MGIPPSELRDLTARIVRRAAPTYLMAVAGNADPMLGYLTTSFAEHPVLRHDSATAMTPAMERRLSSSSVPRLYAQYAKAGGDVRSVPELEADASRKVSSLRERGFDLGGDVRSRQARVDRIYEHARRALYSEIHPAVIRDACGTVVRVHTRARDRDDFIAYPAAGERLRDDDAASLKTAVQRSSRLQIVVSDGLNADAINEQLRALLPSLRRLLADDGHDVTGGVVVVRNGRVRAGYHVAQLLDPEVLIHIIGERPGTGLNTASAYLTYGRDPAGHSRWDPQLDHSSTTAVCGIHPHGKPPEAAASEIARTVRRMVDQRRSGVTLR
jgi:ethanolamine ammonia-lyase small subunit